MDTHINVVDAFCKDKNLSDNDRKLLQDKFEALYNRSIVWDFTAWIIDKFQAEEEKTSELLSVLCEIADLKDIHYLINPILKKYGKIK